MSDYSVRTARIEIVQIDGDYKVVRQRWHALADRMQELERVEHDRDQERTRADRIADEVSDVRQENVRLREENQRLREEVAMLRGCIQELERMCEREAVAA